MKTIAVPVQPEWTEDQERGVTATEESDDAWYVDYSPANPAEYRIIQLTNAARSMLRIYATPMEVNGVYAYVDLTARIHDSIVDRPFNDPWDLGRDEVYNARCEVAAFLRVLRARERGDSGIRLPNCSNLCCCDQCVPF